MQRPGVSSRRRPTARRMVTSRLRAERLCRRSAPTTQSGGTDGYGQRKARENVPW